MSNQETTKGTLRDKLRLFGKSKETKLLEKYGVQFDNGLLTKEGRASFIEALWQGASASEAKAAILADLKKLDDESNKAK